MSSKKVYVSSSIYNLAGELKDRPDYLKTTVIGSIINDRPSITDSITGSYLRGPGIQYRSFARWAREGDYDDKVGVSYGTLTTGNSIDLDVIAGELDIPPGSIASINSAVIDSADYTYWSDQYMYENHPDLLNTDYVADFNESTNVITITFEDSSTESFTPVGFNPAGQYLYVRYKYYTDGTTDPVETGDVVNLATGEPFPSIVGWTTNSFTTTPTDLALVETTTVVASYSDGRPDETTVTTDDSTGTYNETAGEYEQTNYMGSTTDGTGTYSQREIMYQNQTAHVGTTTTTDTTSEDIGGGVTKTTTTTVDTQAVVLDRSYRIDTQNIYGKVWSDNMIFIYQRGTGNATLDDMFSAPNPVGTFLPPIPLRLDNHSVPIQYPDTLYLDCKKAYKKAFSKDYDDIIDDLNDNDDIGDIDYAYIVFGVPLNVFDSSSKIYIYNFFQLIMLDPDASGDSDYYAWRAEWEAADSYNTDYAAWHAAQSDPLDPLYGTPAPTHVPYPAPRTNSTNISPVAGVYDINYDVTVSWDSLVEDIHSGVYKPDAKQGDAWIEIGVTDQLEEQIFDPKTGELIDSEVHDVTALQITWQTYNTSYRQLTIRGLSYKNMIYGGKSVDITASQAMADTEESGFVIPLHEDVFKAMSLVDSTQVATSGALLMINCYQVVKKKWYQTGWFQVVLIIVIIIVSYFTLGAGAGASVGLLGSNLAVGTALGLSGTAAIIAGIAVNAIAAMILVKVITQASIVLFGEKLGAIIGAIAGVIAVNVGTSMAAGQTLSSSFSEVMDAKNLIQLSIAAGKGYAGLLQSDLQKTLVETQQVQENYEAESDKISQAWEQNLGFDRALIDPTVLTDAFSIQLEPVNSFFQRTLMTGGDISDLSIQLIHMFPESTLSTDLPT